MYIYIHDMYINEYILIPLAAPQQQALTLQQDKTPR